MDIILWLVITAVLIGIEIATLGLTTIWFAGGSLAAAIAAAFGGSYPVQILVFLAVSALLLIFTRPYAKRFIERRKTATNVENIPGKTAVVTETIDNLKETGAVMLNGLTWTARTLEGDSPVEKDRIVGVLRVDGVKLIVKEKEK